MNSRHTLALAGLLGLSLPGMLASGATLYSQDFNTDSTASWTVNDPALSDVTANFFYDYSAIGVPAAPNGTGTTGLKMTANNSGGVFSGFSVSPTGQSFTGDYVVRFDLWSNYAGPLGPGGNGTTQLSTYGLGIATNEVFWPGAATKASVAFAHTLDGGSASDYRVYTSAAPSSAAAGDPVYAAPGGAINNSAAYYTSAFVGVSAPAGQLGAFPGQTGTTDAGEVAFRWLDIELTKIGNTVTWEIDGVLFATVNTSSLTLSGNNIFFGHSDTNAGSSTDPNDTLLNVTLVDNIRVTTIPEPAGAALALFGLAGLVRRRRR